MNTPCRMSAPRRVLAALCVLACQSGCDANGGGPGGPPTVAVHGVHATQDRVLAIMVSDPGQRDGFEVRCERALAERVGDAVGCSLSRRATGETARLRVSRIKGRGMGHHLHIRQTPIAPGDLSTFVDPRSFIGSVLAGEFKGQGVVSASCPGPMDLRAGASTWCTLRLEDSRRCRTLLTFTLDDPETARLQWRTRGVGGPGMEGCPSASPPGGDDAAAGTQGSGAIMATELLAMQDGLCRALMRHAGMGELERIGRKAGMRTMYEVGIAKAAAGVTTIEEVLRATGDA